MAESHIVGCMLGTAVGDAIGLPYEGLSRRRAVRLMGPPTRHRFFFGRGMVSDDTEHTCMVAQALIVSAGQVDSFRRSLGWRFRFWLLGLPAGVGLATLRAILKLWIGFRPDRSGVFSAGNGPAMRAAILGAAIDDRQQLRDLVRASTRITHTDPKADCGAFAIALAAQMARQRATVSPDLYVHELRLSLGDDGDELCRLIWTAANSATECSSALSFANSLGLSSGVSGYVYHSVPVAIHAWLAHPHDFRSAVTSVIECGGDTDTTAAMVGGIVGCTIGKDGIPAEWLDGLIEWPSSVAWMEQLGAQLGSSVGSAAKVRPVSLSVWSRLPRNLFFLFVVLYHGLRRLLPPY